jgi:hypothetical protein
VEDSSLNATLQGGNRGVQVAKQQGQVVSTVHIDMAQQHCKPSNSCSSYATNSSSWQQECSLLQLHKHKY